MKIVYAGCYIKVWVSADETYEWAHREGKGWPCSTLAEKRLYAEFDTGSGDLIEFMVNGRCVDDVDATELNAMLSDMIKPLAVIVR